MSTDDRPASRTVESLGKLLYQQKPAIANQIAGLIIAVLLVIGGGGQAIDADQNQPRLPRGAL